MAAKSRSDAWLERIVFAGFAASMVAEWWTLRRQPHRQPGDLDHASPDELASTAPPPDPLVPVGYERRDTAASLAMLVGMLATSQLVWGPFNRRWDQWWYRHRIASIGGFGAASTNPRGGGPYGRWVRRVTAWAAAMVAWDFIYYWEHRWMHEVRLLWAHHVTHHSSERYNLSTALRQPWSNILTHWIFTPMLLLGFPPAMTRRAGEWNLVYQFWIHTEAIDRLPQPFERVLNTASHHRVHHGTNPQYLDRNYGGILIVWDKLFGSFEPEYRRVKYGLTKNLDTFNPLAIAYHEMVDLARDVISARRWTDRLKFVFGRPGWAPTETD